MKTIFPINNKNKLWIILNILSIQNILYPVKPQLQEKA